MNQTCKVCGEPAAGFHFGAFTCEGCKSFFGRSYNNLSSISECKNNGECIINKKNRTACKACRLRKCILVGMSKSGSRYGRRSNWFKIHCLLQEQQQAAAAAAANGSKKPVPTNPLNMLGHPGSYQHALYGQRPPCTKEELMLLGLEEYSKLPLPSPSVSSPDSHNSDSSIDINDRRNSLSRLGKFPENHQINKELFLRLPFAGLSSLPFMHQPGFLPPPHLLFSGYHPALFPHHHDLLKPPTDSPSPLNPLFLNNNNNNNHNSNLNNNNQFSPTNSNKRAEELTKRFYLDAVLNSQRNNINNSQSESIKSDEDDDKDSEKMITMTPPQSPQSEKKIISTPAATPLNQDGPIDLSLKYDSNMSSRSSSASSNSSCDENRSRSLSRSNSDVILDSNSNDNDVDICNGNNNKEDYDIDMSDFKKHKTNGIIPLDLTTKI